jgi:hypothetical protein
MKAIVTVLTFTLFMLSYIPYSYCAITALEHKQITNKITTGKALSKEEKNIFKDITKDQKIDNSMKFAIDQIMDCGKIEKTFGNSKTLQDYRKMVSDIFKKLPYEQKQVLTSIVSDLVNKIEKLNYDDLETPPHEEWEPAEKSKAEKLVAETHQEIVEFFAPRLSFDHLKNDDAIYALEQALDYGIERVVRYFIVNNSSLTKSDLEGYLAALEKSETDSLQGDRPNLPWFYMENGANFSNCKKIIVDCLINF